jgi:hypothetical protein
MILKAIIDDQEYSLNVPDEVIAQGKDFFDELDADMDKGWQMSREWVRNPNQVERCQIVADKLLTALEKENHKVGMLMAGYILSRMPGIESVEIDIRGEMQNTQLVGHAPGFSAPAPDPITWSGPMATGKPGSPKVLEQAGNNVTKVYKVGKAYRFSVLDQAAGVWQDSPMFATEQEAERMRQTAFDEYVEALERAN